MDFQKPIEFVGKHAGNPSGDDLLMDRQDGEVLVWNKYWDLVVMNRVMMISLITT